MKRQTQLENDESHWRRHIAKAMVAHDAVKADVQNLEHDNKVLTDAIVQTRKDQQAGFQRRNSLCGLRSECGWALLLRRC